MFGGGVTSNLGASGVAERNLNRFTVILGLVWVTCIVVLGTHHQVRFGQSRSNSWLLVVVLFAVPVSEPARWASRIVGSRRAHPGSLLVRQRPRAEPVLPRDDRARGDPGADRLPELRDARRTGQGQPAAHRQARAVQDPPRVRQGASERRRGSRPSRRGSHSAPCTSRLRRGITPSIALAGPVHDEVTRHIRCRIRIHEEDRLLTPLHTRDRHEMQVGAREGEADR
jgi:hypothetical protein